MKKTLLVLATLTLFLAATSVSTVNAMNNVGISIVDDEDPKKDDTKKSDKKECTEKKECNKEAKKSCCDEKKECSKDAKK